MNGLQQEYQGTLVCEILDATTPEAEAQIEAYGFGSHGMVFFDASGNLAKKIDGHLLGKKTIRAAVKEVLGIEGDEKPS